MAVQYYNNAEKPEMGRLSVREYRPMLYTNFISRVCYAKMVVCIMFGCYNRPQKLNYKNIKFRCCPREEYVLRKWLGIYKRKGKLFVLLPVSILTISIQMTLIQNAPRRNKWDSSQICWILQSTTWNVKFKSRYGINTKVHSQAMV